MITGEEYQQKYNQIKTVQEWINLLNDNSVNYFELTQSLSNYKPGNKTFWKIAEINGNWEFKMNKLPAPSAPCARHPSEQHILEKAGHTHGFHRHATGSLTQKIVDLLELENITAYINVQPPGLVKNLHIDSLSCDLKNAADLEFDKEQRQPKGYPTMYRIMVALTDWQPGWMFQLGVDQWVGWKKGDIIAFDWQNVPHCTANASFVDRPLLKITASAKNSWIQDCINSGQPKRFTL